MVELASINGRISPIAEACVPMMDRGFLFGDAAYEVIRIYQGQPFRLDGHLDRLRATCRGLRFQAVPAAEILKDQCRRLIETSELKEAALYIHITRGVDIPGAGLAEYLSPNVILRIAPPPLLPPEARTRGVKVVTIKDQRWARSELKTVNLLPRVLAFEDAREAGATEAIWLTPEGDVREGLSSNVFIWMNGVLRTPPLQANILAGITRQAILDLARTSGLAVEERGFSLGEMLSAQEAFISSTTRELVPISQVDDHRMPEDRPGTRALQSRFQDLITRECSSSIR